MELGIYTFGNMFPPEPGAAAPTPRAKLEEIVRLARVADDVGLDVFAVGEHHRLDMAVSAPPVVLAAIARETRRILLSSATTLLNTLDPVRVYEDYATLDLLSQNRAELILGRGSFTESFGLFGYRLEDYDRLFAEKLDLFLQLNREERVTWKGEYRAPLADAEVAPRAERPLPLWLGVGGTPQSFVRAGQYGLPLNLAILSSPAHFQRLIQLYRHAAQEAGNGDKARVAVSSHGHITDDPQKAIDEHWPRYSKMMREGLRNRFPPRAVPWEYYQQEVGIQGALFVGDAKAVAEKILWQHRLFQHDRTLLQLDWDGWSFDKVKRGIEILGQEVAPRLKAAGI
jgi:alkanesulfonate monooxygenase SsuD/methylene tetrahydromethanopterin reductase-like flavin-dependent oxidoreductase (luciferase family)